MLSPTVWLSASLQWCFPPQWTSIHPELPAQVWNNSFSPFYLRFSLSANTSIGARPAHCPPRQSSAQSQSPEGPRVKCMEFSGDSVVYNPTLNDQSQDASGACAYFWYNRWVDAHKTFLKITRRLMLALDHKRPLHQLYQVLCTYIGSYLSNCS